jgi:hypothetical protein
MSDTEFEKLIKEINTRLKILGWIGYASAFLSLVLMFLFPSMWILFLALVLSFGFVGHSAFHNLGDMK